MNLSTVFVLIAAAFTGSAHAAEINNGNLRANALQKNTEVFEDISLLDGEAKTAFDNCAAECAVFKKPKAKDVADIDEGDLASAIKECALACYDSASGNDAAVKSALTDAIQPACAVECTESAAKKFTEVSKNCDIKKSYKCSKGKDCELDCTTADDAKKCEKQVKKCEEEFEECEECEEEISKAISSVKKVAKTFPKCLSNKCVFPSETAIEIA
uniref:Uncharacterized protein n=1 Tax=Skeletonema marinoi TaxID=267567 RepID=A0A7S1CSN8_9STRA|mmetsp:Transcript_487/g.671  ORF Transcript_487/g.671 Transcript_487/m.671 type:complete len:215 (+) Transcript_487:66-710(+)